MRTYFKVMLGLYWAALAICGGCRLWLKLFGMDVGTGFYVDGAGYVVIFNATLAAAPVIMFLSSRLKKPDDDYPVEPAGRSLDYLTVLTGAAIAVFALAGPPAAYLEQGHSAAFDHIRDYTNMALGMITGITFLYMGISGILGRGKPPPAGVMAVPAVWQIILLVTRYNSYTTVLAISDHMLAVLFMVFSSLFFVGMARTVCSQMRRDGRNYTIPAGLCASLCGLLLVIPNYAYMAARLAPMPVRMLGLIESVCVLLISVYALAFVIVMMKSIKKV